MLKIYKYKKLDLPWAGLLSITVGEVGMCTLRNVNQVCRMWLWKGFIHLSIQFSFVQISVIIVQRVEPHVFSVP